MTEKPQQSAEEVLKQTKINLSETAGSMAVGKITNFDQDKRQKAESKIGKFVVLGLVALLGIAAVVGLVFFVRQTF